MKSHLIWPPGGIPEELRETIVMRDIPGIPNWRCNPVGWIMSSNNRWTTDKWRYKSVQKNADKDHGWQVGLGRTGGNQPQWTSVRHLVLLTHGEPRPSTRHYAQPIDGDFDNHAIWNLEWLPFEEAVSRGMIVRWAEKKPVVVPPVVEQAKPEPIGPPPVTTEEVRLAIAELEGGRTLQAVWRERFYYRCRIGELQQRIERGW